MKNQDIKNPLKIVFFGTSSFAVPTLQLLVQNDYEVTAVITQPEKPAGRLRVSIPSPVKKVAIENNIPVFEPHNLKKDEEFLKYFASLNIDLGIVAAYGKIIPFSHLKIPKFGFLNIHPSLLPKYRGPSPVQAAILAGDNETGVSIMLVDEQMDHGPVLSNVIYKIPSDKYFTEINDEIWQIGARLLLEVLPDWIRGVIKPIIQDDGQATYCKLLNRHDSKINWNKTAEQIYNQIRAFNPEPGTWTTWKGKVMNIVEALVGSESDDKPGTIISVDKQIAVATSKCYLILKQIQLEGSKKMDAKDFLNGHPDFLGSRLD